MEPFKAETGSGKRERRSRRGDVIWPAMLVAGGVIFLLNTTGRLGWDVWYTILRLWPVLLVAVGVDILVGRRSALGALLVVVLVVGGFAGGVWLHQSGARLGVAVPPAEEFSVQRQDASQARVTLAAAAGYVRVAQLFGSDNLVEGAVRELGGQQAQRSFSLDGETAVFELRSEGGNWWTPGIGTGAANEPTWDLALSANLPLELNAAMGAGRLALDLSLAQVTRVEAGMGVGEVVLSLPAQGRIHGRISGAIGQTVVVIPSGMAARIRVSGGLAGRSLPADFRRQGDSYVTPGFDAADDFVDLEISQAIGNIQVRRADW